jgi:hypothetical protein
MMMRISDLPARYQKHFFRQTSGGMMQRMMTAGSFTGALRRRRHRQRCVLPAMR